MTSRGVEPDHTLLPTRHESNLSYKPSESLRDEGMLATTNSLNRPAPLLSYMESKPNENDADEIVSPQTVEKDIDLRN